jgi:nicotinamide riboside kinase
MPVRRLTPRRVVITGVENAGKSTLAHSLSNTLGWPLVPEAARAEAAVREGRTTPDDLQRLLDGFRSALDVGQDTLFDTGPIVLDIWAKAVWNHALEGVEAVRNDVDLFLLCDTLPDWEPDPLRSLPRWEDRQALQAQYVEALERSGRPWARLPVAPVAERVEWAHQAIAQHR